MPIGISEHALDHLSQMQIREKALGKKVICSLMLDEMSIKKHIDFCNSKFTGLVDFGDDLPSQVNLEKPATHALVLMVNAVYQHWKLPIGYYMLDSLNGPGKYDKFSNFSQYINIKVRWKLFFPKSF